MSKDSVVVKLSEEAIYRMYIGQEAPWENLIEIAKSKLDYPEEWTMWVSLPCDYSPYYTFVMTNYNYQRGS